MSFERRRQPPPGDRLIQVGLGLCLGVAAACADFERGPRWDDDDSGASDAGTGDPSDGLSYADGIDALLVSGCERCHAPGASAGGTGFVLTTDVDANYLQALDFVNLEDPGASRLLSKAAGQGHGGGTIYDSRSNEYDSILEWIEGGAAP